MKAKAFAISLMLCLLLTGCGRTTYSFAEIEGDGVSAAVAERGETLPGASLVYTAGGQVFYSEDYSVAEPLAGVIRKPPARTVMDAAVLAKKWLVGGERALIIYIDGLGWQQYRGALEAGSIPALSKRNCEMAASMYPTITPVNYASMITGAPPADTGVTARGIHTISCETIFDYAASLGLDSYVSEGDSQLFDLGAAEVELSPDLNGSGSGDDEIFDCAMAQLDKYALILVHFHGVDDAAHEFGPGSDEARGALMRIDAWCAELLAAWDGNAVITADHGQHAQDDTGDDAYAERSGTHGDFAPSDIFVPFITVEKELVK